MRKHVCRVLALLCALALTFVMLPPVVPAFAAGVTSGNCGENGGDNVQWNFDASTKTLTISGTGKMQSFSFTYGGQAPWISLGVETVSIQQDVTEIGRLAFRDCTKLTSVTIPSSVTEIGLAAFDGCTKLTSVTIPSSVTSIESYIFRGCTSLTSMTIPDGVTSIGSDAFKGCTGLTSVTIPDGVTSIGSDAFKGCTGLTSVTIPDSVTSIGMNAFNDCTSLTSVTIPDGVTYISWRAFRHCGTQVEDFYVIFEGDAPKTIDSLSFMDATATVYYPAGNTTWKDIVGQQCGGTLTWKERKNPPYEITIDVNDGKTEAQKAATDAAGILAKPAAPTREGYLFEGWFTGKTGGAEVDFTQAFQIDRTIYAHWKKPEAASCTVTFDAQGGTPTPAAVQTDKDGKISLPAAPTREGYTFEGWFSAKEGGEKVTTDTVFTENTTIYAQWSTVEAGVYTITFDSNGGSETEPAAQKTGEDGKLTALPAPTREGYTLDGWYTEKEGGEKVTTGTVFEKDTTLFAHWTKKSVSAGPDSSSSSSTAVIPPTTAVTKPQEKPGNNKWQGAAGSAWKYTGENGEAMKGSCWLNSENRRYVFDVDGALVTGAQATATAADGSAIALTPDGDLLMNGNLYYLNPARDEKDPSTCYVMTDYLRIRPNYAGQTYYDKDGITFTGWIKNAEGGLRYQTRIPQPGQTADLYLVVWRRQTLPECQHPDHPGDPAYNIPAGDYFFDDEGVLVQKEGWYDGKDGMEYYATAEGRVTDSRAKA